jgi:hypothetical protein
MTTKSLQRKTQKYNRAIQWTHTSVHSESHCALSLQYVDLVQACINARGHH